MTVDLVGKFITAYTAISISYACHRIRGHDASSWPACYRHFTADGGGAY